MIVMISFDKIQLQVNKSYFIKKENYENGKCINRKNAEWMNLERATLKQRMIADEFYEKKLMRPIVSEFLMNNKEAVREEVEGMILTSERLTSHWFLAFNCLSQRGFFSCIHRIQNGLLIR